MFKCLVNQTNQNPILRVLETSNDVQRWKQLSKIQTIYDVINKAAFLCCSIIPSSTQCEGSFSKCGLASAGNQFRKSTKVILAHYQIVQAVEIWKEDEVDKITTGSIPARLLSNSSHKHERVASFASMLPFDSEDFVDALLDCPFEFSEDSDNETEEEDLCSVLVRKMTTFRVSEDQVVAWHRHNKGCLTGF